MPNLQMMSNNELDKIAKAQYKIALVRYATVTMGEAVEDGESILQLYCRAMAWYNSQFQGVHTNDSSNPQGPPPPPPGHP